MDDLTGQTIGQYRLVRKLGVGGMAEVYQAYQPRLDRYVALKFIRPELAVESNFRARFEQEARAIAKLSHGNVVHIYDFGEDNHRYYLVMEYVEGKTLKDHLQKLDKQDKWISFSEAIAIVKQVAGALDYAHKQGIVHRDVKPDNILLTANGRAVLNDFGIAKMIEEGDGMTQTGAAIGTPAYMSPEQIQGQKEKISAATDLYSLGIILYELLTGQTPFTADTAFAVMLKHINDPIPLPHQLNSGLSPAVERVLLKLLAKNPEDRFQTAADFVASLEQAVAEGGNEEAITPSGMHEVGDATRVAPSAADEATVVDQAPDTVVSAAADTVAAPAPTVVSAAAPSGPPAVAPVPPAPAAAAEPAAVARRKQPWWVWVAAVIGALALIFGVLATLNRLGTRAAPGLVQGPLITFTTNDQVFRVAPAPEAIPNNLSARLDELGIRDGQESALNVSPNGDWLLITTTRGDEQCAGWACLAVAPNQVDLQTPEIVYLPGWEVVHPAETAAISSDGQTIVYVQEGDHELDLWAIEREDEFWSDPWLLTGNSDFEWNTSPAFDQTDDSIVFSCGDDQYAEFGGHICEVSVDGNDVEVLIGPEDGPTLYPEGENTLSSPDYTNEGIIFTATWNNSSIWELHDDDEFPEAIRGSQLSLNDHYLGCVLGDGSIVTLAWNEELEGAQLVVTRPDGSMSFAIETPGPVAYGSVGCGQ